MELTNVKWFKIEGGKTNIKIDGRPVDVKVNAENQNRKDFSGGAESITMNSTPDAAYGGFLSRIDEPKIRKELEGKNIYEITIKNVGGLVMPVTIEWKYTDGTSEINTLPATIWRLNEYEAKKTFVKTKEVKEVNLDPNFEYADTNMKNNSFPKTEQDSEFDQFKSKKN